MDDVELPPGGGLTVRSVLLTDEAPTRHASRVFDSAGVTLGEFTALPEVARFEKSG